MDIEKLIERLAYEVKRESSYIAKHGGDKNNISWQHEEGVIISVLEAEFILELLKKVEDGK